MLAVVFGDVVAFGSFQHLLDPLSDSDEVHTGRFTLVRLALGKLSQRRNMLSLARDVVENAVIADINTDMFDQ